VLGLLAVVAVALPVRADDPPGAPPGQYDPFDSRSFQIKDVKTGLRWTRSVSAGTVPFATATSTCVGGTRLPTLKELLTLVDEQPHPTYDENLGRTVTKMIDPNAFDQYAPVDSPYWTSSTSGDSEVWTVDFSNGAATKARITDPRYVRCVSFSP
jgi:hypothetical protein